LSKSWRKIIGASVLSTIRPGASVGQMPGNLSGRKNRLSLTPPGEGTSLLHPRLRHDADVGPRRLPALRILLLGVVVGDRAGNDHVFALLPVHRGRHLVFGG